MAMVDARMSELLRLALYESEHLGENLNGNGKLKKHWLGGSVCESADILAKGVLLPEVKCGDILVTLWRGAYGQLMASGYNLRPKLQAFCSVEICQAHDLAIKKEGKRPAETCCLNLGI